MEWIFSFEIWASLATLTLLEIVLGIDNLVFLTVAANGLPKEKRLFVQRLGLGAALVLRILFLCMVVWIAGLKAPIFSIGDHAVSWRDIILISGGLFLLYKGTQEIHEEVEGGDEGVGYTAKKTMFAVITQIMVLDLVFSLDSIITAIGLTDVLPVMITAITIAIIVMMFAAKPVGEFIEKHPTTKMLALSFLLLIGSALIADGFHVHIPREYIYFAIAFSLGVEVLNLLAGRKKSPVKKNESQEG